jgi:penicillin-binding protein 2
MSVGEDRRRVALRINVLQWGAVAVFATLAIGFWFLQVVQNDKYEEMAENNHQRTLALRAPRGVLFDRNGTVLVENRHSSPFDRSRAFQEHGAHGGTAVARRPPRRAPGPADRGPAPHEPSYRPIVVVEDAYARAGGGRHGAPARFRASRMSWWKKCRRGATRRRRMAAHLFGYVGEANDSQVEAGRHPGRHRGAAGLRKSPTTTC